MYNYFQNGSSKSNIFRSLICHNDANIPVTVEDFNKYVVQPYSNFELKLGGPLHSDLPIHLQEIDDPASHHKNILQHAHSKVGFVLDHYQHPRTVEISSFRKAMFPLSWHNAILGMEGKSKRFLTSVPSLRELYSRIECSIQFSFEAKSKPQSRQPFFSVASGRAWISQKESVAKATIDHDRLELLAMSKFPTYLNQFLKDRNRYLDELAGAKVPYFVPQVAARFEALIASAPPRRVEGVHLKRSADSDSDDVGGTVVAIHQYLSPAFLAYFTTDQDSCAYMDDIRSKHKKDRKIRVSSCDHLNSKPVWVQFGDKSDPYLYLSQKASAGEELWLKIVNYVMGLLEAFVNNSVANSMRTEPPGPHSSFPANDKKYRVPRYATNVAACGDPLVSLFGKHSDLRPGLASDDLPMFTRDNLVVPTGCIQNHNRSITTISWHTNEDPSHVAGSVTQEQNLIHLQLKSVQVYWKHSVRLYLLLFILSFTCLTKSYARYHSSLSTLLAYQGSTIAGTTIGAEQFYNPNLLDFNDEAGDEHQEEEDTYVFSPAHPGVSVQYATPDADPVVDHGASDWSDESGVVETNHNIAPPGSTGPTTNRLKRLTLSARATSGLQSAGMKSIVQQVADKTMKEPKVYGLQRHYDVVNVWGATDALLHTMMGTRPVADPSIDMSPVGFPQVFKRSTTKRGLSPRKILHDCQLSKYRHTVRTLDREIWPKTNPKIVVSVKSAAVMMISQPVVNLLMDEGTLPLIKHPRQVTTGGESSFMDIPFGPMLDPITNQPMPLGTCLLSSAIYSRYGMKLLAGHNEAWKAIPCAAGGILVRMPEKSELPLGLPRQTRLSPLAEMERITTGMSRMGFIFKRSGGNCTLKGQAPPAEAARTAGEGAFFEHDQSIKNCHNYAMEILVEQRTPVAVWGAGDLVPNRFQDVTLNSESAGAEQVFYFGCYRVDRAAVQPGQSEESLMEVINEYKEDYPHLSFLNLRFLLKDHHSYMLVPVDYPPTEGGYSYLPLHLRDNRRPMFEVPGNLSFEKALGGGNEHSFTETSMLTAWFKSGGCNDYRNHLFVEKASRKRKADLCFEGECQDHNETESSFRLVTPQQGISVDEQALGEFEKKSRSLAEQWDVAVNCSLGSFARLLELNVDNSGKVGPLLDYNKSFHHGESSLDNYSKHFGSTAPSGDSSQYMKQLSPASVQKSPTPHAIRTYDAAKLTLMLGNGGCGRRVERKGLGYVKANSSHVADMLFQCLLVEVVRVPIMMEWSKFKKDGSRSSTIQLPTLDETVPFLEFIQDIMSVNKFLTTRNLLQTQYEIHIGFGTLSGFQRILSYLSHHLENWLSSITAQVAILKSATPPVDIFDVCRSSLSSLLSVPQALGSWNGPKVQFFCQHILMNMNELIDDWPFGVPDNVILGFGGLFGAKRLKRGVDENLSIRQVLFLQLDRIRDSVTDTDLQMMGLERRLGTSIVVVILNKREICAVEPEHFGCLDMVSSERETGGSRGSGNRYEVSTPHCHPVPHMHFHLLSPEIARVAIMAMKELKAKVDMGVPSQQNGIEQGVCASIGDSVEENSVN